MGSKLTYQHQKVQKGTSSNRRPKSCWDLIKGTVAWEGGYPTLSETNSSHLKIGHPKRKLLFQPFIFRCYVGFREGNFLGVWGCVAVLVVFLGIDRIGSSPSI